MKKLNLAMLSVDQTDTPSSPETVVLDDNFSHLGNQLEDDLSDLNVAMNDLENIDEAITQAVDVAAELTDESDAIEQAQEQGQLTQTALESIQRNVNSLLRVVGIEQKATFALEAYTNSHYNKLAMESALDSIKAFISRIWEAIKAAFDKTKELTKEILKKYFDVSVKTKARAQAIKKKAEGLKGKVAPTETMVGGESLSKYMRYANKAIEPTQLMNGVDKWTAYSHNAIEGIAGNDAIDEYKQYVEQSSKILQEALRDAESLNPNIDKLKAQSEALGKQILKRVYVNLSKKNKTKHATEVLLGDVRYVFDDESMKFEVRQIDDYKELPIEKTHDVLTVDQVITLCDKIDKHMDVYKNIEVYFKNLDTLKASVSDLAEDAIKSNKEVDYVASKVITAATSSTIKFFIDAIRKVGVGARSHDMAVDKAIIDWCALSLRPL
jgi:hypothetical protein